MLVSKMACRKKKKFALLPSFCITLSALFPARAQCEQVECSLHSVHDGWVCVGHVNIMMLVSILFALGT